MVVGQNQLTPRMVSSRKTWTYYVLGSVVEVVLLLTIVGVSWFWPTTNHPLTSNAVVEPTLVNLEDVRQDVQVLKKMLETGANLDAVREAYSRLENATFEIAEAMYATPDA